MLHSYEKQKKNSGQSTAFAYLGGSITEGAMTSSPKGINRDGQPYDYTVISDQEHFSWRTRTFHGALKGPFYFLYAREKTECVAY